MAPQYPVVVSGPNKYDLMLALFDRSYRKVRPVIFGVEQKAEIGDKLFGNPIHNVEVHINAVSIEDGSGESWIIDGRKGSDNTPIQMHFRTDYGDQGSTLPQPHRPRGDGRLPRA